MKILMQSPIPAVVYNARKRGEDRASDYFKRTENVAGVKDMRFQALMPDILHWLGIKKIDRMLSMSKWVKPIKSTTAILPNTNTDRQHEI
ncbi:Uracil-regulated protein 1 [Diatrype stigma]|uniref:Uracil-regulated protein 1 n=1 Tax=Diatrype stigma TaxID=117547 RepID=A0AAN9V379_9PEZI